MLTNFFIEFEMGLFLIKIYQRFFLRVIKRWDRHLYAM